MVNLSEYQQIFNIENTTERCKMVYDTMDQLWKVELDELAQKLRVNNYKIATYGQTLRTTYTDSLNPKYEEKTRDTSTGKRYFAQIQQRIGNKDVNLITIEFNGVEKQMYVYTELSYYQIYELIRVDALNPLIDNLDGDIKTYARTSSFSRDLIEQSSLEQTIRDMVKPRNRPWIYFGTAMPLEGRIEAFDIVNAIIQVWKQTVSIREFIERDRMINASTTHIMDLIASVEDTYNLSLYGQSYQLEYGHIENVKAGNRRQLYTLKQEGQTIIKGAFFYVEYNETSGISSPMLAVDVEQNNHLYINIRPLLGDDRVEWWLTKSFRTKTKNNEDLKQQALNMLKQHGILVRNDDEYYIGAYDNNTKTFNEALSKIKGDLVCSALIFGQVSDRGNFKPNIDQLPSVNEDDSVDPNTDDSSENNTYNSNFNFSVIYDSIQNCSLTFDKELIRDLHLNLTALDDKHFVILSGISGTGKTQLAKLYANAVYGLSYEDDNPYLSIVPVRPDWTDSTSLFGYYSSFENRYIIPEFLKVLMHAHEERDKPHFIVLDEMNLARVEYYLSDYLSGVESSKEIPLHNRPDLEDIPAKISIPPNLYLLGTINVDETTHSISDKVLDRAFVMTLSDVDLDTYWNRLDEGIKDKLQEEFTYLMKLHALLAPYHLHFGYRTMNEMIQKMSRHLALDVEYQASRNIMLDRVISEKVLPKLRGDDRITELLEALGTAFKSGLGENASSYGHIQRMEKELVRYGATQFWR